VENESQIAAEIAILAGQGVSEQRNQQADSFFLLESSLPKIAILKVVS
jgi:hypothetical protein